jgi:hypothetical protein
MLSSEKRAVGAPAWKAVPGAIDTVTRRPATSTKKSSRPECAHTGEMPPAVLTWKRASLVLGNGRTYTSSRPVSVPT